VGWKEREGERKRPTAKGCATARSQRQGALVVCSAWEQFVSSNDLRFCSRNEDKRGGGIYREEDGNAVINVVFECNHVLLSSLHNITFSLSSPPHLSTPS
jgi:hypothetical protein